MIKKNDIVIRTATPGDYPFVLKLNEENVEVLSPMDEDKLTYFAGAAELFYVAYMDGRPVAFLIALREGAEDYDSENYLWFSKAYEKFLYIDRIVIETSARGLGLGRLLYREVFRHARQTGVSTVTAEIDTIPYNGASLKFHQEMGFQEVGEQVIRQGTVKVSLQAVTTEASDEKGISVLSEA